VPEPSLDLSRLKAVIFDLDGTLYRQGPLRRAMALRLLRAHVFRPATGLRTIRTIAAYRGAQEELRGAPGNSDLAEAQLGLAADHTGFDRDTVAADVERWVELAPLDLLSRFVQPGLADLLTALRARRLKLGVLSDYQALPKLRALGIVDLFDVVLCAQDPEIGVFKPHPRGLRLALQRLEVTAPEALYVGDRAEVDAVAAVAAKVPCAIVSKAGNVGAGIGYVQIASISELQRRLVPA
jgi:phosphoglycolate phosphatase/putative hydrolase of the HAD superfamily